MKLVKSHYAFPFDEFPQGEPGMLLRDYFAAKAMQGLASNPDWGSWNCEKTAAAAYQYADAMLAERAKVK